MTTNTSTWRPSASGNGKTSATISNIRERDGHMEVWKFYKNKRLLGKGASGAVRLVQRKSGTEGGSAYADAGQGSEVSVGCAGFFSCFRPKKATPTVPGPTSNHSEEYALKSITVNVTEAMGLVDLTKEREEVYRDRLRNEIGILKALDHPNVVKAYEVYECSQEMHILMEYCSGGDLYARAPYTESQAADVVSQICAAISYMHNAGVAHRDLKFENIMFESREPAAQIRVLDFGLSKKGNPRTSTVEMQCVGTLYTMSPQALDGICDAKADCWAIGVIAFLLVCHENPFKGRNSRLMENIRRCRYAFTAHEATAEAQDFVAALLVHDPEARASAAAAARHPWVQAPKRRAAGRHTMLTAGESITAYADASELQRIVAMVVAHKSSFAEIANMRRAFEKFDKNHDGAISKKEFLDIMSEYNYTEKESDEMFSQMDIDKNGVILYTEFLAATLQMNGRVEEKRLAEAFDHIDEDDSGFISEENLVKLLGKITPTLKKLIKEADTDGDGMISFDEFLIMFRNDHSSATRRTLTTQNST